MFALVWFEAQSILHAAGPCFTDGAVVRYLFLPSLAEREAPLLVRRGTKVPRRIKFSHV